MEEIYLEKRFCTKCGKEMPSDADYCFTAVLNNRKLQKLLRKKRKAISPKNCPTVLEIGQL